MAGCRINVKQAEHVNTQHVGKAQALKLALRSVANNGHGCAVWARHVFGDQGRGGGRANGRGKCELADQGGCTRVNARQATKGHDGGQTSHKILRVAVDVLHAVGGVVRHGHELNHALFGVVGQSGRFVKILPAHKVLLYAGCYAGYDRPQAPGCYHGGNVVAA